MYSFSDLLNGDKFKNKMSKSSIDNDGFQLIVSKKCGKNKNKATKIPEKNKIYNREDIEINIDKAKRDISFAVEELKISDYFQTLYKAVSNYIPLDSSVELVCFGLGHIGECTISRYQLALLLCLKDLIQTTNILVHDPIFYKSECKLLKQFNLKVIKDNNEGSYVMSKSCITIAFLPHCPKQLTNNFLWSNWGVALSNCVLICNSFTSTFENQLERVLKDTVPYIHKIHPYCEEIVLTNSFKFTDIFNDISVHTFPKEKLDKISTEFWIKGEKPQYIDNEEFITSLMIDKLRF